MNVRSLNANFDKLNELLTNYDILPDIIAISETTLKLLQVYNAKLSGYHFYHKGTTTRWEGVGLFIKEFLSISICKEFDLNIILYSEHSLFISRLETDSAVFLFFFLYSSFALKYADSSNQRGFFIDGLLVLQICSVKSVKYAWQRKTFATRANDFWKAC